ncbi:MAG: bifunctional metallophosphatase/5'-nucleotidase [Pseudomonadales bacterium]|jgi:5'-nucleotidase/UDP-sugar diphosphatase|nr:bifunctional metallophosphatase/5'-nucleotidase [Pseudomonadales bacterium]
MNMLNKHLTKLLILMLVAVSADARELTLLYTNDIESVYEPVESTWREDMERMGGMAQLATLVRQERAAADTSLLLDAGDMFTGSLSKATGGRLVFDLYSAMGYDAVNLGNHEFEYGWRALREVMPRARFPVLNANIFFEGADVSFGQPYTILLAGDIRVGVLGSMGIDAFRNTIMKSNRAGLTVLTPLEILQPIIDQIRPEVDFLVVLTHQNRTAPMQTDKESDPEVQRGFDEDYELAGALRGVDMIIGGHSDHGLEKPVRHPETGTYIGMTFGQGMHLGYAKFELGETNRLVDGRLIPVNADKLAAAPDIAALIDQARQAHPELTEVVAEMSERVARRYYRESPLGSLLADMLREHADADLAVFPAGGIRADLEAGPLQIEEVLNVFPFTDTVATASLQGAEVMALLEKVVSLDYGLAQVSGTKIIFDRTRDVGDRVISAEIGGQPFDDQKVYRIVTLSFTATGGEGYDMFGPEVVISEQRVSDVLIRGFSERKIISAPAPGRLVDQLR